MGFLRMAVKVRRERPDQRRHHRVTAPLFVDVGGWRMRAADWSLGGLKVEGFPESVPEPGTELDLHLTLPFQGFEVAFDATAEVVRNDPASGMFAVKFTELGERERELMSHFIEELVRGSMVDIEDTINRIDVPVTPASLKPDASPKQDVPARRWPVKTIVMSAFYIALGVIVFSYTALLLYTNFYRLEVQTAVITAPIAEIKARTDGRIRWQGVMPGEIVAADQVLVDLLDTELERDIAQSDLAISEQKAKLAYLKKRHLEELRRAEGFATVEMKNLKQTRLKHEATQAELATAELHRNRIQTLFKKGYATSAQRETAEREVIRLRKLVEELEVELRSRTTLAKSNVGKRLYNGDNLVGELAKYEAEVELAASEVKIRSKRKAMLEQQRDRLKIRAPFDGRLVKVLRSDNSNVRRGETVAMIEQPRSRSIKAFLKQDDVSRVGLGDIVDVFVPALQTRLDGRVTSIDRTDGFLQELEARKAPGYTWRGPTDRSAQVTIEVVNDPDFQTSKAFKPGTPVVVVFPRRSPSLLQIAGVGGASRADTR